MVSAVDCAALATSGPPGRLSTLACNDDAAASSACATASLFSSNAAAARSPISAARDAPCERPSPPSRGDGVLVNVGVSMMGSRRLRDGADCDTAVVTRVKVGDADATLVSLQ